MRAGAASLAVLVAVLLVACGSPPPPRRPAPPPPPAPSAKRPPLIHVVRAGETVWRISKRYGTTVEAIARANRLADPRKVSAGQRLFIPPGRQRPSAQAWTSSDGRGKPGRVAFVWPIRGRVTSGFGIRNGAHHDGIDIQQDRGVPIRAAEAGRVIHSGNSLSGYGNMVIIKHTGNFSTVYAHNRKNFVRVGEFVERGQVIGEVGKSGRASAPHVHFEIRFNGSPRNPVKYLP